MYIQGEKMSTGSFEQNTAKYEPHLDKTCLCLLQTTKAQNTSTPSHQRLVICYMDSIIPVYAKSRISRLLN